MVMHECYVGLIFPFNLDLRDYDLLSGFFACPAGILDFLNRFFLLLIIVHYSLKIPLLFQAINLKPDALIPFWCSEISNKVL
jgi:hypothetical protein